MKLETFMNIIALLKATLNGKSYISTHVFVNTKCIIKHEASKFL